jgi:hypothetical protein
MLKLIIMTIMLFSLTGCLRTKGLRLKCNPCMFAKKHHNHCSAAEMKEAFSVKEEEMSR